MHYSIHNEYRFNIMKQDLDKAVPSIELCAACAPRKAACNASIRDVAEKCSVSVSVVSKVMNHYRGVSADVRARVLAAAEEIGYMPNALARGLKLNRSYNIAIVLDDETCDNLLQMYFVTILHGLKREAERRGYVVTLITHKVGERRLSYLQHASYRNLDGIVLMCLDFYNPEVQELVDSGTPMVTIDHPFPERDCVLSDNRAGVRALIQHAVGWGHRRIAFLHGAYSFVADARLHAFREIMSELNLPVDGDLLIPAYYHSPDHARAGIARLLALDERPTCILMPDDMTALVGIQSLAREGLRVPHDLSVAGYDGVELAQMLPLPLTTVRQDGREIGRLAAMLLIEKIENPGAAVLPPDTVGIELLPGETVGAVTAARCSI
ncbi:LacI family transcriptional regulator [Clostridia bacterium]|nr:LacI family transcriptional regulator [Clostridia bacterium]